MAAINQSKF